MRVLCFLAFFSLMACKPSLAERDAFLKPVADKAALLDPLQFYPQGRRMVYAGYSGQGERDLANGFTVVGPAYGSANEKQAAMCEKAGLPFVLQVGVFEDNTTGSWDAASKISLEDVRLRVAAIVKKHENDQHLVMWAVQPEELRPWRKNEMDYLKAVTDTLRTLDVKRRPIFLYNPNHRDAQSLAAIVPLVDVVAKGCYANGAGQKDNRAWVRWSVEQMRTAADKGGKGKLVFNMPELARDPENAERALIEPWVRHDVYLGMMSGADGVLLWSLFPRSEVKATWKQWYQAYAQCGRELNGERALSQVFLFGEKRDDLHVTTVEARKSYPLGSSARNALEANTTQATEGKVGVLHPWTKDERAYGTNRYLFLCNSLPVPTTFLITGFPAHGLVAESAFDGKAVPLPAPGQPLEVKLGPWEVWSVKLGAATLTK